MAGQCDVSGGSLMEICICLPEEIFILPVVEEHQLAGRKNTLWKLFQHLVAVTAIKTQTSCFALTLLLRRAVTMGVTVHPGFPETPF